MKTVAISIDESTLARLDALVGGAGAGSGRGPNAPASFTGRSRSEVVRTALHDYIDRLERTAREERERLIFAKHKEVLHRQAEALVAEQADS